MGIVNQGPGNCYPLLFTTGQLGRQAIDLTFDAYHFEYLPDGFLNQPPRRAGNLQGQSHIIKNSIIGNQFIILKNYPHTPPQAGNTGRPSPHQIETVNHNLTAVRFQIGKEQAEKGRFSSPTGS